MVTVEPGGLIARRRHFMAGVVRRVGEDLRSERWTDLVLHSKEGVPLHVHRLVLAQCPHLSPLLSSLQCCQGRCANQNTLDILLPDFSYYSLNQVVTFLYTGILKTRLEDRKAVRQLLELLGLGSQTIQVEEVEEGETEEIDNDQDQNMNEVINDPIEIHQRVGIEKPDPNRIVEDLGNDKISDPRHDDQDSNRGTKSPYLLYEDEIPSSPSHSGGITSEEDERLGDFEMEEDQGDITADGMDEERRRAEKMIAEVESLLDNFDS